MNLCLCQVHEFTLMHRLNYLAAQSYTVHLNYSQSNNRLQNRTVLFAQIVVQIDCNLHYHFIVFLEFSPIKTLQKSNLKIILIHNKDNLFFTFACKHCVKQIFKYRAHFYLLANLRNGSAMVLFPMNIICAQSITV